MAGEVCSVKHSAAMKGLDDSQCHRRIIRAKTKNAVSRAKQETAFLIGRDERIRTSDPHTPSVMRYQAALRPDRSAAYRQVFQDAQAPAA